MGDGVVIRIGGDERQVALQRCDSNQGIDITKQVRTLGWPQQPPNFRVALEDGIGQHV